MPLGMMGCGSCDCGRVATLLDYRGVRSFLSWVEIDSVIGQQKRQKKGHSTGISPSLSLHDVGCLIAE